MGAAIHRQGLPWPCTESSCTRPRWLLIPSSWRRNGCFVWPAQSSIPANFWTFENLSFFVLTISWRYSARSPSPSLASSCAFEALYTLSLSVLVRALLSSFIFHLSTSANRLTVTSTSARLPIVLPPDPRFLLCTNQLNENTSTKTLDFLTSSFPFFPRVDPSKASLHVYPLKTIFERASTIQRIYYIDIYTRRGFLNI